MYNDDSFNKQIIPLAVTGPIVGGIVGLGLSFTALPILAIWATIAAISTTLSLLFTYYNKENKTSFKKTILPFFSICAAGTLIGVGLAAAVSAIVGLCSVVAAAINPTVLLIIAAVAIGVTKGLIRATMQENESLGWLILGTICGLAIGLAVAPSLIVGAIIGAIAPIARIAATICIIEPTITKVSEWITSPKIEKVNEHPSFTEHESTAI